MSNEYSVSVNDIPEYHLLFEAAEGDVTLKVRFASRSGANGRSFPPKQIHWTDVPRLFGGPDRAPFNRMTFDEWPFTVTKIEVEPSRGQVTLVIME